MNIQDGIQAFTHDPPEAILAARWVESLSRIVKLTFDFAHTFWLFWTTKYIIDSFHQSLNRLVHFALLFPFQLQDYLVIKKLIWD